MRSRGRKGKVAENHKESAEKKPRGTTAQGLLFLELDSSCNDDSAPVVEGNFCKKNLSQMIFLKKII